MSTPPKTDLPTKSEVKLSKESGALLARYFKRQNKTQSIQVGDPEGELQAVRIPTAAYQLLIDILTQMALGNGVGLIPVRAELTTREAAFMLDVSHGYLLRLLDGGAIPYRRLGGQRRVNYIDLAAFKESPGWSAAPKVEALENWDEEMEFR